MGCEYGKPQVISVSPEEPEPEFTGFNEAQIDTIRSTWPLLSADGNRVGAEIFIRIFRESPSVHDLFHHFQIHKSEDLYHSKVFSEHAGRFMGVIQNLVDNLESLSSLDQQLLVLGAKHATLDGYHPEYFRLYTKCILDVWEVELGEEFIHEVRDSWRTAFDYVVDRMTEGFDMCLGGQIQDVQDDDEEEEDDHGSSSSLSLSSSPVKAFATTNITSKTTTTTTTSSAPCSAKRQSAADAGVKVMGTTSSSLPNSPMLRAKPPVDDGKPATVGNQALADDQLIRVQ